ncbi:glycosyltransferase family 4 protein [Formosa sediminum]|uniref:Glycosyltransferase family 4 protein n=1 Tax=Formosa sediminum TaxID=2594004 RepID=A0A516GVZ3_9FLAO|nr:glycosyltransferase family 4 protein [Formosa sediminum]
MQGLNIIGYTEAMFGLGEAIRLNINAAKKLDIPLNLINYDKVKQSTNYQYSFNYAINLIQISLKDLESFLAVIDPDLFKKKYTILFLVWESEYIAPELVENLNLFNEIWTPSEYCKNIFQRTYNNPIIVVPHPVEVHLAPLSNQNNINFFDNEKFSFLFIFSYHSSLERKNPFFLIEAFNTAFRDNDNVELVIKTVGGKQHKKQKQRLELCASKNIKIYDVELDKNGVNHLINTCDSYVSMHHSEGFGLTLAEAMYLGKPTIATNYSGNTEFMKEDNSYLVDYKLSYIENPDNNFCSKTLWANPLLKETADKLRTIYENSDLRHLKTSNASLFVKDKLSFYTIGSIMKDRLNYLYNNFDDLVTNQNQNVFLINQLQFTKIENAKLRREVRRMKKNIMIRFILILKDAVRKLKG